MLIVVIVILRIRCNRYFTLSDNQALLNLHFEGCKVYTYRQGCSDYHMKD